MTESVVARITLPQLIERRARLGSLSVARKLAITRAVIQVIREEAGSCSEWDDDAVKWAVCARFTSS